MRKTISFGGKVKPSDPWMILRHVKHHLRHVRYTDRKYLAAISRPVSPLFDTRCVCWNQSSELWWMNQKWLELRWGAEQMIEWSQLHGTLCTIPLRNSKVIYFISKHVAGITSSMLPTCLLIRRHPFGIRYSDLTTYYIENANITNFDAYRPIKMLYAMKLREYKIKQ
jgi:hypothetical protein